ncbi:MAG: 7-cyano-7-deazaguanine synthase QueC [Planctomycetaceae bacterium]|nr:7-cyano-7-deazaguanine synthase QueC [Planctomycetaceae bacterium]
MCPVSSKAVVLLSGGLDSSTVAAIAKAENQELFALTIDYNQRHQVELDAAKRVAQFLGIRNQAVLPINLRLFGGSSLTDEIEVPKDVPQEHIGRSIPNTYVPARNTVFLSLALAYAETVGAGRIYLGVSAVDFSGYPDCRPEFLTAFERLANTATKLGIEAAHSGLPGFQIHAPLLHWSKAETILKGLELGLDYSLTWTCYDPTPSGRSCGRCESCTLRQQGFREAGISDPLEYEEKPLI